MGVGGGGMSVDRRWAGRRHPVVQVWAGLASGRRRRSGGALLRRGPSSGERAGVLAYLFSELILMLFQARLVMRETLAEGGCM